MMYIYIYIYIYIYMKKQVENVVTICLIIKLLHFIKLKETNEDICRF